MTDGVIGVCGAYMGKIKGETGRAGITDRYLDLVRAFPLRTICSEEELDEAITVIDRLLDRLESLEEDERDYLDALSTMVMRYEAEHHAIPPPSEADLLRFLMEARDLSTAGLAESSGIEASVIGEVLEGRGRFGREQIETLAAFFHVSPAVFLDS